MDNREAQINHILQSLERLPPDAQQGMAWIINHFAFAEEMCRNSEFAPGELEASIQHAMDKKDFFLLALLCFCKILQEHDDKPQ
ncbi:hypothetical protein NE562_06490 [Butyricicoccus faecihominis]|uniref:hypothetical protein n=1 Tax=Butyricicoccus faecihominis TaxID=1712515 RepID=UPI00247AB058|nr:hypothetical protein [Butyricicoccus faecihominis]MCQ5129304.1 hypothetical protein [Butyricicoccus faecihominis]